MPKCFFLNDKLLLNHTLLETRLQSFLSLTNDLNLIKMLLHVALSFPKPFPKRSPVKRFSFEFCMKSLLRVCFYNNESVVMVVVKPMRRGLLSTEHVYRLQSDINVCTFNCCMNRMTSAQNLFKHSNLHNSSLNIFDISVLSPNINWC